MVQEDVGDRGRGVACGSGERARQAQESRVRSVCASKHEKPSEQGNLARSESAREIDRRQVGQGGQGRRRSAREMSPLAKRELEELHGSDSRGAQRVLNEGEKVHAPLRVELAPRPPPPSLSSSSS